MDRRERRDEKVVVPAMQMLFEISNRAYGCSQIAMEIRRMVVTSDVLYWKSDIERLHADLESALEEVGRLQEMVNSFE